MNEKFNYFKIYTQIAFMKICIVSRGDISIFPATQGASVKLYSTIKFLSMLGHDVYFVTSENDKYVHAKDGNFEEKKYPKRLVNFLPYGKRRRSLLLRMGIPKEDVILYKPLLDFNLWLKTLYVSKKERVDIIQAEFPAFAIPTILTKLMRRIPSVLVEHNVECFRILETSKASSLGRFVLKLIEKIACRFSGAVVAITEEDKKRLENMGVKNEKIFIIPHGVDLNRYKNLDSKKIRELYKLKDLTLIFHGVLIYPPNLKATKNIAEKIMPELDNLGIKAKALVVGNYPPKDVEHKDLIFTGVVEDLPSYIGASDIAIVPIVAGGGMRMKILEYFAAKRPVISTPKGAEGIKVTNGKQIILTDVENFPKEILRLIKSEKDRKELTKNAFEFVQKYDWSSICKKYVELYNGLIKN